MNNNSEVKEKKFDFVKLLPLISIIVSLLTIGFITWLKRNKAK